MTNVNIIGIVLLAVVVCCILFMIYQSIITNYRANKLLGIILINNKFNLFSKSLMDEIDFIYNLYEFYDQIRIELKAEIDYHSKYYNTDIAVFIKAMVKFKKLLQEQSNKQLYDEIYNKFNNLYK